METIDINLSPAMMAFIQEQLDEGGFQTASEYIDKLIREDQRRKAGQEIDRELLGRHTLFRQVRFGFREGMSMAYFHPIR